MSIYKDNSRFIGLPTALVFLEAIGRCSLICAFFLALSSLRTVQAEGTDPIPTGGNKVTQYYAFVLYQKERDEPWVKSLPIEPSGTPPKGRYRFEIVFKPGGYRPANRKLAGTHWGALRGEFLVEDKGPPQGLVVVSRSPMDEAEPAASEIPSVERSLWFNKKATSSLLSWSAYGRPWVQPLSGAIQKQRRPQGSPDMNFLRALLGKESYEKYEDNDLKLVRLHRFTDSDFKEPELVEALSYFLAPAEQGVYLWYELMGLAASQQAFEKALYLGQATDDLKEFYRQFLDTLGLDKPKSVSSPTAEVDPSGSEQDPPSDPKQPKENGDQWEDSQGSPKKTNNEEVKQALWFIPLIIGTFVLSVVVFAFLTWKRSTKRKEDNALESDDVAARDSISAYPPRSQPEKHRFFGLLGKESHSREDHNFSVPNEQEESPEHHTEKTWDELRNITQEVVNEKSGKTQRQISELQQNIAEINDRLQELSRVLDYEASPMDNPETLLGQKEEVGKQIQLFINNEIRRIAPQISLFVRSEIKKQFDKPLNQTQTNDSNRVVTPSNVESHANAIPQRQSTLSRELVNLKDMLITLKAVDPDCLEGKMEFISDVEEFVDRIMGDCLIERKSIAHYQRVDEAIRNATDNQISLIIPNEGERVLLSEHKVMHQQSVSKGNLNTVSVLILPGLRSYDSVKRKAMVIETI